MSSNSKKVLIVDDDEVARRLLRRLLQRDYCLAEATTGEQALEIFPVFLPDLLTLDIMMPGIEGPKVCRLLRSNRFGQRVPVIIVSAEATREDKARAYEAGADDYIVKPFDPDELRSRIKQHLEIPIVPSKKKLERMALPPVSLEFREMRWTEFSGQQTGLNDTDFILK